MDLLEAIKTRRSIRKFEDRAVTKAQLEDIVSYAAYAPSWKNTQTARYIAVLDEGVKRRIAAEAVCGFEWNKNTIEGAPALILVTTLDKRSGYEKDGSFSTTKGTHWQSFDAGIAAQTFCLAAHGMGLGTCILGIYEEARVKEITGIDPAQSVSAMIVIGYPAKQETPPKRRTAAELLEIL